MPYWAHSGRSSDGSDFQSLADHLNNVAALAESRAAHFGLGKAARVAGSGHDLGKYTPEFQRRLFGDPRPVDHSTAGAAALADQKTHLDRVIGEMIGYAVLGHHTGLPDRHGDGNGSMEERLTQYEKNGVRLDPAWRSETNLSLDGVAEEFIAKKGRDHAGFDLSVATRMVFSALVDADYSDTEQFYADLRGQGRPHRDWAALPDLLPHLVARFDAVMAGKPQDSPVNLLRGEILDHVRTKSVLPPGLFTLTVPTGGGKTLASLGFAMDHARRHGHRRIIYVIPFTSVIEQTADVFKAVLGSEHILEHHSSLDVEGTGTEITSSAQEKLKLAMEDWAAPFIVTTAVQFFESLFSAKPSRCRKLHNIAGSVIILDEAQTLPRHLLLPCIRMMDALARHYGCTLVLCTATQPALGKPALAEGLDLSGRELAPDPSRLVASLRRTRIRHGGEMSNDDLVAALSSEKQALVIVNSRRHAFDLFREARHLDGVLHLSTRQHAADRRRIISVIKDRLKRGQACRVIATSLVEAGVDFDFPKLWRAEAGLEQQLQAAGRCNREGKRPIEESLVTIFTNAAYPPPRALAALIGDGRRALRSSEDPTDLTVIERYFKEGNWRAGDGLDREGILGLTRFGQTGTAFQFRTIEEKFQMIEDAMVPVVIASDPASQAAIAMLQDPAISSGKIARSLQSAMVSIPVKARDHLLFAKKLRYAAPDVRGDQFAILEDQDLYAPEVGLIWENVEYQRLESTAL